MTKRLTKQIIVLSMVCMGVILAVIVAAMNVINYKNLITDLDEINHILIRSVDDNFETIEGEKSKNKENTIRRIKNGSRYFRVSFDEDGNAFRIRKRYVDYLSNEEITKYAKTILRSEQKSGFIGEFRYHREAFGNQTRVVGIYAHDKLEDFNSFLKTSILMAVIGYVIVYVILRYGVRRFVEPIEEANRKQRRFIADAGHEIKTPLAVISVNVDVLKMEQEENECLDDISKQVKRLNNLTQDLLYLTNMGEVEKEFETKKLDFSQLLKDAEHVFKTMAEHEGKKITSRITEHLSVKGNPEMLDKLIYILFDNAVKYATENSEISVSLKEEKKMVCLEMGNETQEEIEKAEEVFERFYRAKNSRESDKAGYGIGLSIAKSAVELHKGSIEVQLLDEHYFMVRVLLPIN